MVGMLFSDWQATTQHHFNMEGRHLVRTGTFEEYRKDPEFARKVEDVPAISMYPGYKYDQHAWGLAVNLSSCTGCNACVVACQSENNIPTICLSLIHISEPTRLG